MNVSRRLMLPDTNFTHFSSRKINKLSPRTFLLLLLYLSNQSEVNIVLYWPIRSWHLPESREKKPGHDSPWGETPPQSSPRPWRTSCWTSAADWPAPSSSPSSTTSLEWWRVDQTLHSPLCWHCLQPDQSEISIVFNNQSEISIILYQPIRDQYWLELTNEKLVFTRNVAGWSTESR